MPIQLPGRPAPGGGGGGGGGGTTATTAPVGYVGGRPHRKPITPDERRKKKEDEPTDPRDQVALEIGRLRGMWQKEGKDSKAYGLYRSLLSTYGLEVGLDRLSRRGVREEEFHEATDWRDDAQDRRTGWEKATQEGKGALLKAIDLSGRPQQAVLHFVQGENRLIDRIRGKVTGEADENFEGQGGINPWKQAWRGFTGAEGPIGFREAALHDKDWGGTQGDVLELGGMIATDPLNLVSAGSGSVARTGASQLAKAGLKDYAEMAAKGTLRKYLKNNPAARKVITDALAAQARTGVKTVDRKYLPGTVTKAVEHGSVVKPLAGGTDLSRGGGILTRAGERVSATVGRRQVRTGADLWAERALNQMERRGAGGLVIAGRTVPGTGNQALSRALYAAHLPGWHDKTSLLTNSGRAGVLSLQETGDAVAQSINGQPLRYVDPAETRMTDEAGQAMADWYEAARHAPDDPEVLKGYDALQAAVEADADVLGKTGWKFDPEMKVGDGQEFDKLADEVGRHQAIPISPTPADELPANHPMARPVSPELAKRLGLPEGTKLNDLFRAIHDLRGHLMVGNDFSRHGEEVAFRMHAQMMPEEALGALATETRGQNTWLQFGPPNAGKAAGDSTKVFPAQKAAIMPPEFWRPLVDTPGAAAQAVPPPAEGTTRLFRNVGREGQDPEGTWAALERGRAEEHMGDRTLFTDVPDDVLTEAQKAAARWHWDHNEAALRAQGYESFEDWVMDPEVQLGTDALLPRGTTFRDVDAAAASTAARVTEEAKVQAVIEKAYDKTVGPVARRADKAKTRAADAEEVLLDLQADLSATLDAAPGTPTFGLGEKIGKARVKAKDARTGADNAQAVLRDAAQAAESGDPKAVRRAAIAKQAAEQAEAAATKAEETLNGLYDRLDGVKAPRTPSGAPEAREGAETAASAAPAPAAAGAAGVRPRDTSRLDALKEELKTLDASEEGQVATEEAMDRAGELQQAIREEAARLTPEAIDLPAARAAAEALPPPAPGTVRLYRSELPLAGRERFDPMTETFVAGGDKYTGRWFTDNLDVAGAEGRDVGVFKYVDVPEEVANDPANLFARESIVGAGKELTLPEDLAAQARPLAAAEEAAPAGRRPITPRPGDERRPAAGYGMGKRMQRAEERSRQATKEARDAEYELLQAETKWRNETLPKLQERGRTISEGAGRRADLAKRPRLLSAEGESATGAEPYFKRVIEQRGVKSALLDTKIGKTLHGTVVPRSPMVRGELGKEVADTVHDVSAGPSAVLYHQPVEEALARVKALMVGPEGLKKADLPVIYQAMETKGGIEALDALRTPEGLRQARAAKALRTIMDRMREAITATGAVDPAVLRDADTYMWRQLTEEGREALGKAGGEQVVNRFMREQGLVGNLGQGGALKRRTIMPEASIEEAERVVGGQLRKKKLLKEGETLYEQDPLKSVLQRTSAGHAAAAEAATLDALSTVKDEAGNAIVLTTRKTDNPAVQAAMEKTAIERGMVPMDLSTDANIKAWAHPEVKPEIERLRAIVYNDEAMKNWARFMDYVTGIWKRGATVPITAGSGFVSRNVIGNLFNNFVKGVSNPAIYKEAWGLQRLMSRAGLRARETGETFYEALDKVAAGDREYLSFVNKAVDKVGLAPKISDRRVALIHSAISEGILHDSFYTVDMSEQQLRRLATTRAARVRQGANPFSRESYIYAPMTHMNQLAEHNGRLAHFIDKIDKLGDPQSAARSVRDTLFDYSDLTPWERQYAKRVHAFYTFTRKNLAFQAKMIKEAPGRVRRPIVVEQALFGSRSEEQGDPGGQGTTFLPSYAMDSGQRLLNPEIARFITGKKDGQVLAGLDFPLYNALDTVAPAIEMAAIGIEETPILNKLVPAEGLQPRGGNWSERAANVARESLGLTSGTPAEAVKLWFEQAGEFDSYTGAPFVDRQGKMNVGKWDRFLALTEMLSPGITKSIRTGQMFAGRGKYGNKDYDTWRIAIGRAILGANLTPVDEKTDAAGAWEAYDTILRQLRQEYPDGLPSMDDLAEGGFTPNLRKKPKKPTAREREAARNDRYHLPAPARSGGGGSSGQRRSGGIQLPGRDS